MNVGRNTGALQDNIVDVPCKDPTANATCQQLDQFGVWDSVLRAGEDVVAEEMVMMDESVEDIDATSQLNEPAAFNVECPHLAEENTDQPVLSTRQCMVHNIVTTHLQSFLCGDNPPHHLVIVHAL